MVRNRKLVLAVSAVLAFGAASISMWLVHSSTSNRSPRIRASALEPIDDGAIEKAIRDNNLGVSDLSVRSVGGIVILRGSGDAAASQQAVSIVKSMGPQRVANLITANTVVDDAALQRDAERALARANSLSGCTLRVRSEKGIVTVTGTVQYELQKDAARTALRTVRGAKEVKVDLTL